MNPPEIFKRLHARNAGAFFAAAVTFASLGCGGLLAQDAATSARAGKSAGIDLSGFWERRDDVGSGSFGGTLERIPKAPIKPEIAEENRRMAARQAAGYVVS